MQEPSEKTHDVFYCNQIIVFMKGALKWLLKTMVAVMEW